jgi:hypothetical protein
MFKKNSDLKKINEEKNSYPLILGVNPFEVKIFV